MALCFVGLLLSGGGRAEMGVGDCVVFREGGEGRLLKAPSYWVKGRVSARMTERRRVEVCPVVAKPLSAYSREDRVRLARAAPCVFNESDAREIEVNWVRVLVDSWETPWSHAHGSAGLLFRGTFIDHALKKGESIEMAAEWLEPCESAP